MKPWRNGASTLPWHLTELSGTCLSPGYGWGTVSVIGPAGTTENGVLVASSIEPSDVPAIFDCSALILESGDLTSHAAITARELGIPALANVINALDVLLPGELIYVDATRGRILRSRPGDDACPLCEDGPHSFSPEPPSWLGL